MAGSSSSMPSSGEANPYPYPSHVFVPNFVSVKLSGPDTYDVWQMQMRCLLESHDMLGFVSSQSHALGKEKAGDDDDMMWRRSDALVKGWILGSLSQQTLEKVVKPIPNKDFTAKGVWDKLWSVYGPHEIELRGCSLFEIIDAAAKKMSSNISARMLHGAILKQSVFHILGILHGFDVTLSDQIIDGNTALHVAVRTSNNTEFLENMLDFATKDNQSSLDMRNSEGSTLLHVAAIVGNTEAAKLLVERNQDLLYAKDNESQTPLDRAASNMHTDTFIYLFEEYSKVKDLENGDLFDRSEIMGSGILVNAISSKDYGSALSMMKRIWEHRRPSDPNNELMAIAQNFPPNVNFLERHMLLLFSLVPVTFVY
ncbi:hypothetical protein R6Q59_016511 [Mikania micrantha]